MPYTKSYDLEWFNNKLDHKKVWEMYVGYASDWGQIRYPEDTVWGLHLDVKLCPETGNSNIVVIKLWF